MSIPADFSVFTETARLFLHAGIGVGAGLSAGFLMRRIRQGGGSASEFWDGAIGGFTGGVVFAFAGSIWVIEAVRTRSVLEAQSWYRCLWFLYAHSLIAAAALAFSSVIVVLTARALIRRPPRGLIVPGR